MKPPEPRGGGVTEASDYIRRLVDDFEFFADECWRYLGFDAVAPLTWVERAMLRAVAYGPSLRGVLGARGVGKTTLAMIYCCWLLLRDPERKILVISKKDDHAQAFIHTVGRWFRIIPFLRPLCPSKGGDWDSKHHILVGGAMPSKDMSLRAEGSENMIEGTRAHTIIADDIETTTNVRSTHLRDLLDQRTHEFVSILFPTIAAGIADPTEIIALGTYHHQESVYTKLAGRGYQFTSFPLEYPTESEQRDILNVAPEIIRRMEDEPSLRRSDATVSCLFNHRFNDEEVLRRRSTGPVYYALQYMLRCNVADLDATPLRLSDLIVYDGFTEHKGPASIAWGMTGPRGPTQIENIKCHGFAGDGLFGPSAVDDELVPYQNTIMWIDPAGGGKDLTAAGVFSVLAGRIFCHSATGFKGQPDETMMHEIASIAKTHRVKIIYVEDTGLGALFTTMLRPVVQAHHVNTTSERWACPVEGVKDWAQRHQKEHRIISVLSPIMQNHRLIINSKVADNPTLQKQISQINHQRDCLRPIGDDFVELLACGCWMLARNLGVNTDQAAALARRRNDDYERYRDTIERLKHGHITEPRWLRTA